MVKTHALTAAKKRRGGKGGKNESRGNEVDLSPAALGLEVNLKLTHSFGTNVVSNRNNVEIVTISDEGGNEREYVLAPAGQHLGLTRVDDGRMCFIEGTNSKVRPGSVREIVAMNLSYNGKHIAVCEKIIEPKDPSTVASLADIAKGAESGASAVVAAAATAAGGGDLGESEGSAGGGGTGVGESRGLQVSCYVSVYQSITISLTKQKKTLSFAPPASAGPGPIIFTKVAFSHDSKHLVAVGDEGDYFHMVIWDWARQDGKVVAQVHFEQKDGARINVTRVCFNPSDKGHLTTTGPSSLRQWTVDSSQQSISPKIILPTNKEKENFVDHTWMVARGQNEPEKRMVAVTDGPNLNEYSKDGRSFLMYLFEVGDSGLLELKIPPKRPHLPKNGSVETIIPYGKGFVLAGGGGFFSVYDRSDDRKDPYMLIKSFNKSGDMTQETFTNLSVHKNDELLVAYTKNRDVYSFQLGNIDIMDEADPNHFLRIGGTHRQGKITCMDLCLQKPLLATGSEDRTVRVWTYTKWRCDYVHRCSSDPTALAFHPSGFQLLVGFNDRVQVFNVLHGELRLYRELSTIAKCRDIKYAHGGHFFAVGASINVTAYNSYTLEQLRVFPGHIALVQSVSWAADDLSIYSVGAEGHAYGWELATGRRIEALSRLNQSSPFSELVVHVSKSSGNGGGATGKEGGGASGGGGVGAGGGGSSSGGGRARTNSAVAIAIDGAFREVSWEPGLPDSVMLNATAALMSPDVAAGGVAIARDSAAADGRGVLTCLTRCQSAPFLIAGSSNGNILVFPWPLQFQSNRKAGSSGTSGDADSLGEAKNSSAKARGDNKQQQSGDAAATTLAGSGGSSAADIEGSMAHISPNTNLPLHAEFSALTVPIERIAVTYNDKVLLAAGADGTILVFKLENLAPDKSRTGAAAVAAEMIAIEGDPMDNVLEGDAPTQNAGFRAEASAGGSMRAGGDGGAGTVLSAANIATLQADIHCDLFNTEVVQVSLEEIEERKKEVEEMRKKLEEMKNDNEFQLHVKDVQWEADIKKVHEDKEDQLKKESDKYNELQGMYDEMKNKHFAAMGRKEQHHIQITQELENQYEYKLAMEMERYDKLSEEIEAIQQRCEGLLMAQKQDHDARVREHELKAKKLEKKLSSDIEKLAEDEKHNRSTFKEILDQQEREYELELQQLMSAAQAELTIERENTAKMRVLVQDRTTTIEGLRKKMDELKTETHRQDLALSAHKVKNEKMETTLEHFKRHMQERESTLEDKEKGILELRRKNITLDNFRFVLDHRVQQLMEERGPITQHIQGLEGHIDSMYDELENEYGLKKQADQTLDAKEMKIHTLAQELSVLRSSLREKESYITSFKRDLSSIVGLIIPKDIEDAVKEAYQKYVKEEKVRSHASKNRGSGAGRRRQMGGAANSGANIPEQLAGTVYDEEDSEFDQVDPGAEGEQQKPGVKGTGGTRGGGEGAAMTDPEMQASLDEAYAQRDCVERLKNKLRRKLDQTKKEAATKTRNKLEENTQLMSECNELRQENITLRRKVDHLRQAVRDYEVEDRRRKEKQTTAAEVRAVRTKNYNRPSTAGAMGSRGGMAASYSQPTLPTMRAQQQSINNASSQPMLMSVKQIRTKDGELKNEDMDTTDSKTTNTNVPVGGGGPFAGTRARNRGKPKDMVLSEENFTLAKTLDEQNRIVAMQRLEISGLKGQINQMRKVSSNAALPPRGRQDVNKLLADQRKRNGTENSTLQQRHDIPGTPEELTGAPFRATGYR